MRAFFWRFLAVVYNPRSFGPLIIDCLLLIQSTWSGRQLGPDLVYPMMGIRKRQSGRLARLILDHSQDQQLYELRTQRTFPQGIDPPCVTVIDLDRVSHAVIENGYSIRMDLHGLVCLLVLVETIVTLLLSVFILQDKKTSATTMNHTFAILINLALCGYSLLRGDGTLTLAQRPDTPTSGCAVLLDQDFTVVLNGNQSVVEAIAERHFNLSYSWTMYSSHDHSYQYSSGNFLGALCEGASIAGLWLCYLAFLPPSASAAFMSTPVYAIILYASYRHSRPIRGPHDWWRILKLSGYRGIFFSFVQLVYFAKFGTADFSVVSCHFGTFALSVFLLGLVSAKSGVANYPIRRGKFLDAIGRPRIRKWQFDTPAAATTFQCLVLCHSIARPIGSVDVLALLDMLVPDERDVWKVWKRRVADRIVHEEDISFTPTIPMFREESQQDMLVELLGEAKQGYDTYRRFFGPDAPPDPEPPEDAPPPSFARCWSTIRHFFCSS